MDLLFGSARWAATKQLGDGCAADLLQTLGADPGLQELTNHIKNNNDDDDDDDDNDDNNDDDDDDDDENRNN